MNFLRKIVKWLGILVLGFGVLLAVVSVINGKMSDAAILLAVFGLPGGILWRVGRGGKQTIEQGGQDEQESEDTPSPEDAEQEVEPEHPVPRPAVAHHASVPAKAPVAAAPSNNTQAKPNLNLVKPSNGLPISTVLVTDAKMTGPDADGEFIVEVLGTFNNSARVDVDYLKVSLILLDTVGRPVSDSSETFEQTIEPGESGEFSTRFTCTAGALGHDAANATVVVSATGYSLGVKALSDISLDIDEREIIALPDTRIGRVVAVSGGTVTRGPKGDDGECLVEVKVLAHNLTDHVFNEIQIVAPVTDTKARDINSADGTIELRSNDTVVISGSAWIKEKQLKVARMSVSIRAQIPACSGYVVKSGFSIVDTEIDSDE